MRATFETESHGRAEPSRRHVLMAAFAADPDMGSEFGAGWAFLLAAARYHRVTVITRPRHLSALRKALAAERVEEVGLIAVSVPKFLDRFPVKGTHYLGYLLWNIKVACLARQLEPEVDVAHHVTYGIDWLPTGLHLMRRTPLVWGPVGGYAPFPRFLVRYLGLYGLVRETTRFAITTTLRHLTMCVTRNRVDLVVCANRDVARYMRRRARRVVVESQVALADQRRESASRAQAHSDHGRVALFVGRLQAWKGPHLALDVLSELPDEWRLEFYGDGPERRRLTNAVERGQLTRRVVFRGHTPRSEVIAAFRRADVLLFPSMHDASGFVVAEALAEGCPVVCLDVGGPPLLVEDGNGVAVPPGPAAVGQLRDAVLAARRRDGAKRWHADRLPRAVESWYSPSQEGPRGRSGGSMGTLADRVNDSTGP